MSEYWDEQFGDKPQVNMNEGYDQTWPFNFKWAFDSRTGQTDVWRVKGGIDGRPTHRAEVRERWGRDPQVQDGDVMGLATYTPPEKKFDGTLIAPGDLRIQTYYGQPTPESVTAWFEQNFPGSTVRDSMIVQKRLGRKKIAMPPPNEDGWDDFDPDDTWEPEGPIYKWVWNEKDGLLLWQTSDVDGEPWHDLKAMQEWGRLTNPGYEGDILGYAFPNDPKPGVISVESYDAGNRIPPKAFAAVKAQLAEWHPHDQVIGETSVDEKNSFGGDPADLRTAAVQWAWEHLSEEPLPRAQSDSETPKRVWAGLTRLFRKEATQFQPGDRVAIKQDPEGKAISPSTGTIVRIYKDPIDRHGMAIVNWDYEPNPDLVTAQRLDYLVPYEHQYGLFDPYRLSAQRLGFFKVAADINELAANAIQNLMNREDLVMMAAPYVDQQGKPAQMPEGWDTNPQPGQGRQMEEAGFVGNPKYNPRLYGSIQDTLGQLPAEVFKYYPWVVKQMKKNWDPQRNTVAAPWGPVSHLRDILTQAFQHMEYLRSQPANSPNKVPIPDINQLDFPALEQWVYQRNSTGIDVRPGYQWQYKPNDDNYAIWADSVREDDGTGGRKNIIPWNEAGPYRHDPQRKIWELSNGWQVWPVWSEQDLKQEGELMGHCVGGYCRTVQSGHDVIFSLRDPKGEPHVTIELDPNGYDARGMDSAMSYGIVQIQGKGNQDPEPEYKAMVKEFFQQLRDEGYDLTQRIDISNANDLEEYEYLSAPNEEYGVPIEKNIDEYGIARDLVEQAADGYGSYTAQDALESLIDQGIIDYRTMYDAIRYEADDALETKARDLQSEWEYYEKPRLEQEYEDEKAQAAPEEVWNEETEEYEESDEDFEFPTFEEWLEQNYPDEYQKEAYGFEEEAESELSEVVDLRYRFSKVASAPTEPPNYRKQEKGNEACHLCKMMFEGKCWGYGNKEVEPDMVCDSFTPEPGSKTSSNDYLDWGGWDGAHRFVTDGKEILTDPETETINEKAWGFPDELGSRFLSFHPDSKGFAHGWTLPTKDGMGIGIWAPSAGMGDEHEPGLHDIIGAIEKEFGKPAHLITNPDHLSDEKMYQPIKSMEWQETS